MFQKYISVMYSAFVDAVFSKENMKEHEIPHYTVSLFRADTTAPSDAYKQAVCSNFIQNNYDESIREQSFESLLEILEGFVDTAKGENPDFDGGDNFNHPRDELQLI